MNRNRTPWIVIEGDYENGKIGRCLRCQDALRLKLPMRLDAMVLYMKAFVLQHGSCKEPQP